MTMAIETGRGQLGRRASAGGKGWKRDKGGWKCLEVSITMNKFDKEFLK